MRDSVASSLVFGQLDDLPGQAAQAPQAFAAIPQATIGLLTAPRDGQGARVTELVNSWARRHDSGQGDSWGAVADETADKASLLAPLATLLAAAAGADGVLLRTACKPAALIASSSPAAGVPAVTAPSAVAVNKAPCPRAMAQIFSYPENTVILLQLRKEASPFGEVTLVDPFFRDAFLQQPSTSSYSQLLEQLPRAFVGSTSQLRQLVALLVEQSRIAYMSHGLSCPPWRRFDAMLARWLPKHFTDTRILSPAGGMAPAGTNQQQQQQERSGCTSDCSGSSAASDCTALCRFASDASCCTATSSATAASNAGCHRSDSIMTVASDLGGGSPAATAATPWSLGPDGSGATSSSGARRSASGMRVIHGFQLAAEDADGAPAGSDTTSAAAASGGSPRNAGPGSPETPMPDAGEATDAAVCSSRPLSLADALLPPWTLQQPPARVASAGLAAALSQQPQPASHVAACAAVITSNGGSSSGSQRVAAGTGPCPAASASQAAAGAGASAQPSPWAGFEPPADARPDAWVTFADVAASGPDAGQAAQPAPPRSSSDIGWQAGDGTQQQHRQQQKQQASLVRRLPLLPDSAKRSCIQARDYSTICVVKLGAVAAGSAGAAAAAATGSSPGHPPAAPTAAAALSGLRVRSWCVGCN